MRCRRHRPGVEPMMSARWGVRPRQ
jgi:hypothetical protein